MSNRGRNNKRSTHELARDIASVSTTSDPGQPLIQRTNQGILIPIGADLAAVISELEAIESDRTSGSEVIDIETNMGVPPWEGAQALATAIQRTFGILRQLPDRNGRREQLRIEISNNKTVQIPWGFFDLPGLSGYAVTSSGIAGGQSIFCVTFKVQRRHEQRVESLIHLMRQIAGSQCLHRGQAFSVTFRNAEGKLLDMAVPVFFPLSNEQPVFNRQLTESIERNILVPLTYADELSKKGFSLKRGVLFAGTYGVGKTLLATYIAKMAIDAGWTFIYVKNSSELPDALRFAMRYQPVVIFGEDIDRVAGIDRTDKVNELLNQLDGVDGKTVRMLTILTTNHPENINAAMMRPGRIDLVLKIDPPDAETVERMLVTFGADNLAKGIDLSEPARLLAGQSPARIREMLQRSTLEVLRRTGDMAAKAVTADLVAMAEEVVAENPSSSGAAAAKPRPNGDGSHLEARA